MLSLEKCTPFTVSSKSVPNATTVSVRVPAGDRWQTQVRYFEKSLIKGLFKAVGRVTKSKRENVLVTDGHEGTKG